MKVNTKDEWVGEWSVLTGDPEVVAEEGSTEGADDAGKDEVAGDPPFVLRRPPGDGIAAGKSSGHLSLLPGRSLTILSPLNCLPACLDAPLRWKKQASRYLERERDCRSQHRAVKERTKLIEKREERDSAIVEERYLSPCA